MIVLNGPWARNVLLLMLMAAICGSQALARPAVLAVDAASGDSGTTVSIPVLFDAGADGVQALQFDLMFSPALSFVSASAGDAAAQAGKTVMANALPGRVRVLIYGLDRNLMRSGAVADLRLHISGNALSGPIPIVICGIVASDADGRPVLTYGTAGSVSVLAQGGATRPLISGISVSDVTSRSAVISWMTDLPTDSAVEYWTTDSERRVAALSALDTGHSIALNQLRRQSTYYFRVQSTDAEGNHASAGPFSFRTAEDGTPALVLPRMALDADKPTTVEHGGAEVLTGIALANLDDEPASVTFTAVGRDGSPVQGSAVVNPRVYELNPKTQLGKVDLEIFGGGLLDAAPNGWVKLESATPDINGFFLTFDDRRSFMDGANLSDARLMDFAFTEIREDGSNKINIANSNTRDACVKLELMRADGTVRSSRSLAIKPNGALVADLFTDIFPGITPIASDYVRAGADAGVRPFQVLRQKGGDISILAGQDLTAGETRLFSPQYVLGGPYRTSLSVINLDAREGTVQLRFLSEEGFQIGAARYLAIPAHGKVYIEDPAFFLEIAASAMAAGYVEIVSDGIRIAGSTMFGDIRGETFASTLALVPGLHKSAVFSHVASNDLYFTGIAVLNPNPVGADVTMELYGADGALIETVSEYIPPGRRKARLLSQCFNYLIGNDQTSGYVRLIADQPVASFSLFGTHSLSILAAIPPQVMP